MKVTYHSDPRNNSWLEIDGEKVEEMKVRKKNSLIKKALAKYEAEELLECVLLRYGTQPEVFKHQIEL